MKYLSSVPFAVGGAGKAYSEGWDTIFGKCPTCGRRKGEQGDRPLTLCNPPSPFPRCNDEFHARA
jgi:hypothetical protein